MFRILRNVRSDPDAFQKYRELCARNGISVFSADTPNGVHTTNVSNTQCLYDDVVNAQFLQTGDSSYTGPSVSNQRKRTRQSFEITSSSNETDTSKRACTPDASSKSLVVRRPTRRPPRVGGIHAEGSSSGHARGPSLVYDDLGDCAHKCRHCGDDFWYRECLKGHSHSQRPNYHLCCGVQITIKIEASSISKILNGVSVADVKKNGFDDIFVLLPLAKYIIELKPQLNKIKEAQGRGIIITAYAPYGS
ncbi:hypothetical protein Tco_0866971, partial [Tanacetum coccineum]